MTLTRVVHCKREPFDIYIGRPTKWANPFVIGRDGTRKQVIAKFRDYASTQFTDAELRELHGKVLGCWCKPKDCHGDVLAFMSAAAARLKGKVDA